MSIYLDNSATTKICKEALEKYISVSQNEFGNPSSLHGMGLNAEKEIDSARLEIRNSIKSRDAEIIFTSSGSEANNLAIIGRALSKERYKKGAKIITTDSEHASVSSPISKLAEMGFKIARIPTKMGAVDIGALEKEMTPDVILVTVMMVNNETGALYDISSISQIMRAYSPDAYLHVDATQSYLKIPFTAKSLGADMITISSHKIEGPKGVGALIVAPSVIKARGLSPIIFGGGQEKGLRSGTENVPGIAAFAEAVKVGFPLIEAHASHTEALRSYLIDKITNDDILSSISITNPKSHAPHIINVTLPSIKSETMLHYLSSLGIYVSSGSACSSNSNTISSALTAFGRSAQEADSSIRISFSHRNDFSDVDALADALKSGISRLARIRK